jgi:4'-phosphopantetheinyl transferase
MTVEATLAERWRPRPHPPLDAHAVHVWRIPLDDEARAASYRSLLSDDERMRASRFVRDVHRRRFAVAHGALRIILSGYVGAEPDALDFVAGEHGKPALRHVTGRPEVEFNLSHSDDLALVAVAQARPVGVDLERWSEGVEHLDLAERFFSPGERDALRALAHAPALVEEGFFAAWTRKEAYLKATGHGIARGLHHFDVALAPGEPPRLLADRLDGGATERWTMIALEPAPGYSAALVVESPLGDVLQFTM